MGKFADMVVSMYPVKYQLTPGIPGASQVFLQ